MPLGQGFSAEEQLTGKAEFGGIQLIVYPMKTEKYEDILERRKQTRILRSAPNLNGVCYFSEEPLSMGISP